MVFWLVVVLALSALLVSAFVISRDKTQNQVSEVTAVITIPPSASAAIPAVTKLSELGMYGVAAQSDPIALKKWAYQVNQVTEEALNMRATETQTQTPDDLTKILKHISLLAKNLDYDNPVQAASSRTSILLAIDLASKATAGLPVIVDLPPVPQSFNTPVEPDQPAKPVKPDVEGQEPYTLKTPSPPAP